MHTGLYHKDKTFACEFCDFKAGYQHKINRHTRQCHAKELSQSSWLKDGLKKCTFPGCDYMSTTGRVNTHAKQCHEKEFGCKFCSFKSFVKNLIPKHMIEEHSRMAGLQICNVCGYTTTDKAKLKYHKKDKHGESFFSCDKCKFKSGYENNLYRHKKKVHDEPMIFECNQCDNYKSKRAAFTLHLRTRHNEKQEGKFSVNNEKCKSCDTIPSTKINFQIHLYWKHSKSDLPDQNLAKPFNRGKKSKVSVSMMKTDMKMETTVTTEMMNKRDYDIKKPNWESITMKEDRCQESVNAGFKEYFEKEDNPWKTEEEEDISDDEECRDADTVKEDTISDTDEEEIPPNCYLCPISSCTFSMAQDDLILRIRHLETCHPSMDTKLSFMKL